MQSEEGIWYPMGGTRAVPEALVKLGRELGVRYHTSKEVERLVIENGKVTGLVVAGEALGFDAVVSNEDAVRTYRELVGGEAARRFEKERDYEPACSGVVLYLGLKKRYEHLAHHCFRAIRRRSSGTFTILDSWRRTRPAIWLRRRGRKRGRLRRVEMRCTFWYILPICGRNMIGTRCFRSTGR
jgi:phytoene dehydrogenase-like protein